MTSSKIVAVLAAGAVSMALSGCNAGSGTSPTQPDNANGSSGPATDAIDIGLVAEPASLDFTTTDGAAIPQVLLDNVYETLVKVDQDGEIVESLATDWEVSKDRKTYTFTLARGVLFSNGEEFDANDVKFSLERVKSDWSVSLKSQMDLVDTIEVVNDHEVKVTLTKPSNSWLYSLTTRVGAMMDPSGVADLATTPVGTGPYTFGEWQRGTSITLERNADYWGAQPHFDTVTFSYFKDPTALNNALLTHSINVIGTVQAPESLGQFEGGDFQIIEGTTNGEVVLSMNNSKPPFDDLAVRQAARYAIDHQVLLDTCWAGRGTLIGSMVPPTDPWYQDRTGDYPHNLAKAKKLLKDADAEGAKVRLRLPTLPYATSCGPVVESMLEDAGFVVTIDELEFPAAWLEDVFKNADYEMSIIAHVEPRDMRTVFGNPDYYTKYGTEQIRRIFAEADAGSPKQQITKMEQAAKVISQDAAADFLFLLPNLIVADKGITGLPKNAITESFDLSLLGRG